MRTYQPLEGKKKSQDRVSLILCANVVGTHKIPNALIGKPKALACIKDRQWPVPYFSQAKAWMDVEMCWKWFNEVFLLEMKKRTKRRVILLLDNASNTLRLLNATMLGSSSFPQIA
jgi:hypothetical protein